MDFIFDIDGTLADASHRLHLINDMAHWVSAPGKLPKPNWEEFLSDEQVAKDTPIPGTWELLTTLILSGNRIVFITGRPATQRGMTWDWLCDRNCPIRGRAYRFIGGYLTGLFMRTPGDRRPSHIVKRELLDQAKKAIPNFNPVMVFEDRKEDTAMWREAGLLCCQVAEGDY